MRNINQTIDELKQDIWLFYRERWTEEKVREYLDFIDPTTVNSAFKSKEDFTIEVLKVSKVNDWEHLCWLYEKQKQRRKIVNEHNRI